MQIFVLQFTNDMMPLGVSFDFSDPQSLLQNKGDDTYLTRALVKLNEIIYAKCLAYKNLIYGNGYYKII